jgi:hypothetical protein
VLIGNDLAKFVEKSMSRETAAVSSCRTFTERSSSIRPASVWPQPACSIRCWLEVIPGVPHRLCMMGPVFLNRTKCQSSGNLKGDSEEALVRGADCGRAEAGRARTA